MKKFYLLITFLLLGKLSFADSTFLPGLEFHYLYRENEFIFGTSERGRSEKDYTDFLLSDEISLGEKVSLISALASYFEWIHVDDNPDNDGENYFESHTEQFRKEALNTYQDQLPADIRLLITLMEDYRTFSPNTIAYDRLAEEIENSLTAQSVKVIAYAYDVLYNHRWNRVEKYEEEYLEPYKSSWQNYREDIRPDVHKNVEEWLFYIHQLRSESIPEGMRVVPEEESLVSDEPLEIESYKEDGGWVTLARTMSGENFSRNFSRLDENTNTQTDITYKWFPDTQSWREISKKETQYDEYENPVNILEYTWDKKAKDWLAESKSEITYKYEKYGNMRSGIRTGSEWNGKWEEVTREEIDLEDGKPYAWRLYKKNKDGDFILIDKFEN